MYAFDLTLSLHYLQILFTAGPKPIFTTGLGAGGELSAVKIELSPPVHNTGRQ
jgi:hypothetical protein